MTKLRAHRGIAVAMALVASLTVTLASAPFSRAETVTTHNFLYPTNRAQTPCYVGSPGAATVCRTDNATVTWYMDSSAEFALESNDRTVVTNSLAANYQPTDLTLTYDSSPVFSGSGETDIVFQEGTLPSPYAGYTWCNDAVDDSSWKCEQTYIRVRGYNTVYPGKDTINTGVICHETGHAVGLVHGVDTSAYYLNNNTILGCMRDPVPATAALKQGARDDINHVY